MSDRNNRSRYDPYYTQDMTRGTGGEGSLGSIPEAEGHEQQGSGAGYSLDDLLSEYGPKAGSSVNSHGGAPFSAQRQPSDSVYGQGTDVPHTSAAPGNIYNLGAEQQSHYAQLTAGTGAQAAQSGWGERDDLQTHNEDHETSNLGRLLLIKKKHADAGTGQVSSEGNKRPRRG